jgi:hypothetical protein
MATIAVLLLLIDKTAVRISLACTAIDASEVSCTVQHGPVQLAHGRFRWILFRCILGILSTPFSEFGDFEHAVFRVSVDDPV